MFLSFALNRRPPSFAIRSSVNINAVLNVSRATVLFCVVILPDVSPKIPAQRLKILPVLGGGICDVENVGIFDYPRKRWF